MISQETLSQVDQLMNIVEIISDHVKLKRTGNDFTGLCPFHNEKTPSFHVHPAKKMFKCFGCGKSGDAIQFLMEHQKQTYPEAIQTICKKYNIDYQDGGRK